MRRLVFAVLCIAGRAWAQPCTPLQVRPAAWPAGLGHRSGVRWGRLNALACAGGKHFFSYEDMLLEGLGDQKAYFAVGQDPFHPQYVPIGASWAHKVSYHRGIYHVPGPSSGIFCSVDGTHWQLSRSAASERHVMWTGESFMAVSWLGEVFRSVDGNDWTWVGSPPPLCFPTPEAVADARRLLVSGYKYNCDPLRDYIASTEDFVHWDTFVCRVPPGCGYPEACSVRTLIGNGWYTIERFKTRDGKSFYPLRCVRAPAWIPGWEESGGTSCAGVGESFFLDESS